MARTPKRLHGPALVTNAAVTKYTVPALTKTVVRHIHVANPGPGALDFTLSIGADAAGTRLFDAHPIAEDGSIDHFGFYVLEVAEIIQAFASVTGQAVLVIDGEEITLG